MKKSRKHIGAIYPFNDFPSYLEIKIYLGEICRSYPQLASIEIIGMTRQYSEVYMLKLQKDMCSPCSQARDVIFVDAAIHAREWITTSSAMYFINYVILNHHMLDHTNYYIIPVVNVDGYMFSMEKKCYRLWRKNRNLNCSSDMALQGVDLNRNFPIGFGMPGSSDDPGAFNYRGEQPLSESASQGLSFALNKYHKKIVLYISLHAYGNAILYPWSFTKERIPDCRDLILAGMMGRQAFCKASGGKRKMQVGNSAELFGLAAGTSTDYARYVHRIKFSYIFELQGYGSTGFTPHRRHIPQIGYETTMAIFAMARHVQAFYRKNCSKGLPPCVPICDDDEDDDNDTCDEEEEEEEKEKCKRKRGKLKCKFQCPPEEPSEDDCEPSSEDWCKPCKPKKPKCKFKCPTAEPCEDESSSEDEICRRKRMKLKCMKLKFQCPPEKPSTDECEPSSEEKCQPCKPKKPKCKFKCPSAKPCKDEVSSEDEWCKRQRMKLKCRLQCPPEKPNEDDCEPSSEEKCQPCKPKAFKCRFQCPDEH